jgi:LemA protein
MNPWIAAPFFATVGVFFAVVLASIYNRLVSLKSHCENSFAQIEVQLRRRYDLIPNLVECVRHYLTHERETLEQVISARDEAVAGLRQAAQQLENSNAMENWVGAEGKLSRALSGLTLAMENYPHLKGNRSVADLMEQLTSTGNRIAFARQAHNDWVTGFNSYRQAFPQCSFAGLFGFSQNRKWLEFADAEIPATSGELAPS